MRSTPQPPSGTATNSWPRRLGPRHCAVKLQSPASGYPQVLVPSVQPPYSSLAWVATQWASWWSGLPPCGQPSLHAIARQMRSPRSAEACKSGDDDDVSSEPQPAATRATRRTARVSTSRG